jgi:hypothetical protein
MKELEDFDWFPALFRNFQTRFIGWAVTRFNFYKPFIHYVNAQNLSSKPLTDLCSGSGEPALSIFNSSNCFSSLMLTDKYPNPDFKDNINICYQMQPADVLQMEFHADRYYTMFNAFHHFSDPEKQQLAAKMKSGKTDVFCVEVLEPTALCLLKVLCMTTIGCLLFTPFIRPLSFSQLFFTYIIPVNLFTITFDGIVSVFKSRSVKQYQLLFANDRHIRIQQLSYGLGRIIVIHISPTV